MSSLKNKTVFITGASRGIGRAIALRCAEDGANVVIAAKTVEPHPKLPGTIHTVAKEVEEAGGKALPVQVDIRFEEEVQKAIDKTVETFGGIDILVNNASAIFIASTEQIPMKRFDLLMSCNMRGAFLCSRLCIPHLEKSDNPHILNLSPPLNLDPKWFANHIPYTISKYGMSMCTLGMSAEYARAGIAVNSLWPKTTIATSAIEVFFPQALASSRNPEIVSDAAYAILTRDSRSVTGKFFIDEEVLAENGVTDFTIYGREPGHELQPDLFL